MKFGFKASFFIFCPFFSAVCFGQVQETPKEIMTKACNSYYELPQVQIKALVSVDEIGKSGLRIQRNAVVEIQAKLPNKFKAESQGDENFMTFFDGAQVTALDTFTNYYAQAPLEGDLLDFLSFTESLQQPTPALDLIIPRYCLKALESFNDGELLGKLKINDKNVQHIVFVNSKDEVNFQVWVDQSESRYVIRKAVITSFSDAQQLDYQYLLVSEDIKTPIFDGVFDFVPNDSYSKTEFLANVGNQ